MLRRYHAAAQRLAFCSTSVATHAVPQVTTRATSNTVPKKHLRPFTPATTSIFFHDTTLVHQQLRLYSTRGSGGSNDAATSCNLCKDAPKDLWVDGGAWPVTVRPEEFDDAFKKDNRKRVPYKKDVKQKLKFLVQKEENGSWPVGEEAKKRVGVTDERMVRLAEDPYLWHRIVTERGEPRKEGDLRLRQRGFLIMGQPGIGKSYFLDVLLSFHLGAFPNIPVVVFELGGVYIFSNINGSSKRYRYVDVKFLKSRAVRDKLIELGHKPNEQLLVLHDLKSRDVFRLQLCVMGELAKTFDAFVIVASASNYDSYSRFLKDYVTSLHWLPTLTREETSELLEHHKEAPDAVDRDGYTPFEQVGGVPRYLLFSVRRDWALHAQDSHAKEAPWDPARLPLSFRQEHPTNDVIQAIARKDRTSLIMHDFLCKRVRDMWKKEQPCETIVQRFLNMEKVREKADDHWSSVSNGSYGDAFEDCVLAVLERGWSLQGLPMEALGTANSPHERRKEAEHLPMPRPMTVSLIDGFEQVHGADVYGAAILFFPTVHNFAGVNAIFVLRKESGESTAEAILLQVTTAREHKVAKAILDVLAALKKIGCQATRLVWIVDSKSELKKVQRLEDGVKHAAFNNIPQYVSRIDDEWLKYSAGIK